MDYRYNAAESAAGRQLEAQQNQYNRELQAHMDNQGNLMQDNNQGFQQWLAENQMGQSQNQFMNNQNYNQWNQTNQWDFMNSQNNSNSNWMNGMLGQLMA